jgi:hypothetical protein
MEFPGPFSRYPITGTEGLSSWPQTTPGNGIWEWLPEARGICFLRLVDRMVRWLTKDPDMNPVQTILPESARSAGQEIEIKIKLREEDLSPNLRSTVSFSVLNPDGLKVESKLKPAGRSGEYLGSFLPQKGGIYKLKIETSAGSSEESMVVAGALDSLDAAPDHEQLKKISASTGGKFLGKNEDLLKEIEGYTRTAGNRFIEERRSSIWATPFVMVFVLGFLIVEWYLKTWDWCDRRGVMLKLKLKVQSFKNMVRNLRV